MIEIKSRINGSVLKQVEAETLSGSNLSGSDLSSADLRSANLSGSDLSSADLRSANLSDSDLRYSNLSGSNLSGSDLRYSDLRYSNLSGSNLSGSDLSGSNLRYSNLCEVGGNGREIKSLQICRYKIVYTAEKLWIGCQCKPIADWWNVTGKQVERMDHGASDLLTHLPLLRQIVAAFPAVPTGHEATVEPVEAKAE